MKSLRRRSHQERHDCRFKAKRTRSRGQSTGIRRSFKGGEVIGTGSFGCVLRPALACDGESALDNHVTKIGRSSDIEAEWNKKEFVVSAFQTAQVDKSNPLLITDFFILPTKMCDSTEIKNLTNNEKFTKDCINSQTGPEFKELTDLKALQIPDGGKTLSDYYSTKSIIFEEFWESMCKLLRDGIVPLNSAGVIHGDGKPDNVVYGTINASDPTNYMRLIDWGQAVNFNTEHVFTSDSFMARGFKPLSHCFLCQSVKTILDDNQSRSNFEILNLLMDIARDDGQFEVFSYLVQSTGLLNGDYKRSQVTEILNKFRKANGEFGWEGYVDLLRANVDVYRWVYIVEMCAFNFEEIFADSHLYDLRSNEDLVKSVFRKYMLDGEMLATGYTIETLILELRSLFSKRKLNTPTPLPTCQW